MFQIQTMNNNTIAKLIIMIRIYINKIITQMKKKIEKKIDIFQTQIMWIIARQYMNNINFIGRRPNNNERWATDTGKDSLKIEEMKLNEHL